MSRYWLASLLTVFYAAAASPALADNIVVNGGFEADGFTTGPITGYTESGNTSGLTVGTGIAHSGNVAFEFNNVAPIGYLTQALPTVAGAGYLLTFYLRSPDVSQYPANSDQFLVNVGGDASSGTLVGGTTLFDQFNLPASMAPANDPFNFPESYALYSFNFTATSGSTNLIFGGYNTPFTFLLDDISVSTVSPVPEPASLALIAGGLVAGALARRKPTPNASRA